MIVQRLGTHEFAQRFVAPRFPRVSEILSYPMVKPILDRIDANPGSIFVIQGAPQIFKTLVGQLFALRSQLIEPVAALWYGKNEKTANEIADEKFNPLYDQAMPQVQARATSAELSPALLYHDRYKRTNTRYVLPGGEQFLFLSAGIDINRQSKSAGHIFLDEPWEYEAGWIKEIQRRRADFPLYREIHMQTGPNEGSFSDELWEQSTQEVWHMRCTACKKLIPPEVGDGKTVGGIRYDSGPAVRDADGKRILSATRASVTLECPRCGHRHANTAHARKLLNAGGVLVATNSNPESHIHGFRCPALPFRDWSDIAIENITASRAMRRGDLSLREDFVRKTEAKTWREQQHLTQKKVRPLGPYKMGDLWADELKDESGSPWRIATIDVQADYYVLVIRSWGKWSRSRLRFTSKPLSVSEINDTLTAHGVLRERVFLDARFEPTRVRRLAVQCGWKTLMGDKALKDYLHPDGLRRIYDEPKLLDAFTGTTDQTRFPFCVEILFSKQSALNRVHLLRTETCQPDPTHAETIEPIWTAAEDAPEWYWREIDAHYRVKETERDGTEKWVWKGLREDHAGDCEAMGVVVASMAGLTGAESLPEQIPEEEKKAA